jgi:deoxyhypusine synthase
MPKLPSRKIAPIPMPGTISVVDLIDGYFTAYNSARLREICHLLTDSVLQEGVTVGVSLSGALTPAGFGVSVIAPLMRSGFIDWMVSTGANLYHDLHYGLGLNLYSSNPFVDDIKLRQEGRVRIYDIVFDYDVLLGTDAFIREILTAEVFQKRMGTAEFHYLLGKYIAAIEAKLGVAHPSLLATAYECGVPIYTSSPGDSSIGMNIAAMALEGNGLILDPMLDVNETAAIAYGARDWARDRARDRARDGAKDGARDGGRDEASQEGKSAAIIIGGGSPKNFLLQTQPQLHEVLGLPEKGHDFFIQITDARPDTGGLSGATPSEAVSWGKVDPDELPNAIVCYTDSTIALPLITAYVMNQCEHRPLKRLYDRREELMAKLKAAYEAAKVGPEAGLERSSEPDRRSATYPCGTPRP